MSNRFQSLGVGAFLIFAAASVATANPPEGNGADVETVGLTESVDASARPTGAQEPVQPERGTTRAQLLAEIESTDPTAWLMRFGSVEKRPLLETSP